MTELTGTLLATVISNIHTNLISNIKARFVTLQVEFVVKCLKKETGNRIVTSYIVNHEEPVFKL